MKKLLSAGAVKRNTLNKAAEILAETCDISELYDFIALYAKHKTKIARRSEKETIRLFKKMNRDLKNDYETTL